jgi:hypothetical protein
MSPLTSAMLQYPCKNTVQNRVGPEVNEFASSTGQWTHGVFNSFFNSNSSNISTQAKEILSAIKLYLCSSLDGTNQSV